IKQILINRLKIQALVIGYDYHFGRERRGNPHTLESAGQEYGFKVVIMPPFYSNDVLVRSSLIRQLIADGKVVEANELLGWSYSFSGKVVKGSGRGHNLGFPTANLMTEVAQKLIPADGVYFVKACLSRKEYYGILNIGVRKTFDESERTIELYLINFPDQELYGREIRVAMLERLRDELKFETTAALEEQMQADLKLCIGKISKKENETEVYCK
ncbi:MAG: riboflavin kinase, partial [Candidatus Marinimicrobia bacterium]|nr:riboflavin kinase [Candidatus Neomarinimicrobiota bacterium]